MNTRRLTRSLALVGLLALSAAPALAQGRRGQDAAPPPPAGQDLPGITPAEVQQMFDAAALVEAQQRLTITDDQFPQFLRRFKTLQDIRRQGLNERTRRVNQLQRLLVSASPGQPLDETAVNDQLKSLRDLDARVAADVARAYDAIDQVLTVRQRAQFRVFEEQMERRKIDLVTRARQANRQRPQF
jgi:Spy/CpxP family protein refolding chaperone